MFEWNAGCVQLVQVRQYIQGLDYWAAQKLILQSFHCKDCLFRHIFFPFDLSFKLLKPAPIISFFLFEATVAAAATRIPTDYLL